MAHAPSSKSDDLERLARKRAARTEVSIQPAKINGGPGLIVHVGEPGMAGD